jgi:hypothetical protein
MIAEAVVTKKMRHRCCRVINMVLFIGMYHSSHAPSVLEKKTDSSSFVKTIVCTILRRIWYCYSIVLVCARWYVGVGMNKARIGSVVGWLSEFEDKDLWREEGSPGPRTI